MVDLAETEDEKSEKLVEEDELKYDDDGNVIIEIPAARKLLRRIEAALNDYAGWPMPLTGLQLAVESRHPDRKMLESLGKNKDDEEEEEVDEPIVRFHRGWWDSKRSRFVYYYWQNGRLKVAFKYKHAYVHRLDILMNTISASRGWDYEAELRAQEKLKELIKPHLFEMYQMMGVFMETSPRSGVTYLFRRLRPTVAMSPQRRQDPDSPMVAFATLCLHPVAYYVQSFAGAMVPTDDVIAHLLYMRGDEHAFWKNANQHPPQEDEAGI